MPGTILIVDDEETIRFVLQMKLSKEGYFCMRQAMPTMLSTAKDQTI